MKYLFIAAALLTVSCKPSSKAVITEITWALVEINGQPVNKDTTSRIPRSSGIELLKLVECLEPPGTFSNVRIGRLYAI